MKGRREPVYAVIFLCCIFVLYYSLFSLRGREYYLVSQAIILLGIILFMLNFEKRKPTVAELIIVAVMCALAVVSRISFFFLPTVKPIAAVVILTGISLGAETGFITGALSAFVSNFYFGQGSWTPFQMFALGLVGFFAGMLFQKFPVRKWLLGLYAVLSVLVLYGGIVDINTLFFYGGDNTWQAVRAVYGAGFFMNLSFGISTAVFLMLFHKPVLNKLMRVKRKLAIREYENEEK